ncbi:hypothetical protein SKAU_G00245180 [Synaphobranchus kaupii]|uniref:Uncharacterized protein n=1 Tax=Synaphobranchus kaupii TaxID=118154 RepID=A0A9Q1IR42_SYNKA|nr:hypothetical protein SKAU_G00245180 [Synaphobranchus kaupii]
MTEVPLELDVSLLLISGIATHKPSTIDTVNQDNVVKVGHRQVVNMIRQGGNHLVIKVVTVSRNMDPEDTTRKKDTTMESRSLNSMAPLGLSCFLLPKPV